MTTHTDWISNHYPTPELARLNCAEATEAMVAAFPDLRRVRGHAMIGVHLRPHWWCVTPDGRVVDPTAIQWETKPAFYMPLDSDEEPHGKCYNCGELLFVSRGDESYWCSECCRHPATP